jgi:hypothetical protein
MAVMAVEEGQSRCLGGGYLGRSQKGLGRLRGAGLVALNPQPNCEGAGALTSGQSHHPRDGAGATMGRLGVIGIHFPIGCVTNQLRNFPMPHEDFVNKELLIANDDA